LGIKTPLRFHHALTCPIELHFCPFGTPNIHYLYTKINLLKLCVVESNGVWWNGTRPYIDYNETWWIGLMDWIGGIIGLMELLV
jgi:hypothetical protein